MLEFKDVSYVYGKNTPFEMTAVDHVSFAIKDNAVTGLIGHTGSGKSTLAQMTNGTLKADLRDRTFGWQRHQCQRL